MKTKIKLIYLEVEDLGNEIIAEARLQITNNLGTTVHTYQTEPYYYKDDSDYLMVMNEVLSYISE